MQNSETQRKTVCSLRYSKTQAKTRITIIQKSKIKVQNDNSSFKGILSKKEF
jgi:hypothetical protein